MEAMFSKMMEGCMKGMSEENKKKMMACCGSKMKEMSACFKKTDSTSDQSCCAEKA